MTVIDQSSLRNVLLRQLPPEDFARLLPHLEPMGLRHGEVLAEPGQPFTHATFLEHGIVSVVSISSKGRMVESSLVGRGGFVPMGLVMDADRSSQRYLVQVPGQGHRVPAEALREALTASPTLHRLLLRFAQTMATQASCTSLSNAVHAIDERLARWLLMCHDRSVGDEIAFTHGALGIMLAVRRPSITTSMNVLEASGFVRTRRGSITITDRQGLEAFAADAYGQPEAEYQRLIGPPH